MSADRFLQRKLKIFSNNKYLLQRLLIVFAPITGILIMVIVIPEDWLVSLEVGSRSEG
jgi:hypothetical protein